MLQDEKRSSRGIERGQVAAWIRRRQVGQEGGCEVSDSWAMLPDCRVELYLYKDTHARYICICIRILSLLHISRLLTLTLTLTLLGHLDSLSSSFIQSIEWEDLQSGILDHPDRVSAFCLLQEWMRRKGGEKLTSLPRPLWYLAIERLMG